MKKSILFSIALLSLGVFWYCSDNDSRLERNASSSEEQLQASSNENRLLKNETLTPDELFNKVISMNLSNEKDNVLHVDYQWNKDHSIKVINYEEINGMVMALVDLKEDEKYRRSRIARGAYTVTCYDKNDHTEKWSKECNGKWSCGSLIVDCLDEGGCSETCRNSMYYDPESRTIHLIPQSEN